MGNIEKSQKEEILSKSINVDNRLEIIDTEVASTLKKNSGRYESNIRAIRAIKEVEQAIKKGTGKFYDLDLAIDKSKNPPVYYIVSWNIVLKRPFTIKELELFLKDVNFPELFNYDLELSWWQEWRRILRYWDYRDMLSGGKNLYSKGIKGWRDKNLEEKMNIPPKFIQMQKEDLNDKTEEVFEFVQKVKWIKGKNINISDSVLPRERRKSNNFFKDRGDLYPDIWTDDTEITKNIEKEVRKLKIEKMESDWKTFLVLKYGKNIIFGLKEIKNNQGIWALAGWNSVLFYEQNILQITKDIIEGKRTRESIKKEDIMKRITKQSGLELPIKDQKDFELERFKDFLKACVNLEEYQSYPTSFWTKE